ncbi:hypothetical protein [Ruegeria atlantica]|uniref:Uncharacterized protein n=1 Tax=Ruegeria atlantica TaxID=81569 RepID=A0A0P1EVV9_9RHOB|nr:hypothetical protein [Ruegeria atlantica]CUH46741.1 hypothetical protein RUA4292_00907 [Ruegeria atlantica]
MRVEGLKNISISILSVALAVVAVFALKSGKDVTVKVSKNGTIELDAREGQSLTQLLDKGFEAVEASPEDSAETTARKLSDMRALTRTLKSHGYYALNDSDLVHEIRGLEKEDPLSAGLRDVLYDLEGPFSLPGTLRGADSRMWQAIADLYEGIKSEPRGDSQLFATLYTNFIQQETVFSPFKHEVTAEGVLLHDANGTEKPMVYTCPDSFLKPGITVLIKPTGGSSNIMRQFTVRQDPVFHACAARTPFEFLSGSEMKLGLNRVAFDQLFPPRTASAEQFQGRGTLSVIIYPRNTQPALFASSAE